MPTSLIAESRQQPLTHPQSERVGLRVAAGLIAAVAVALLSAIVVAPAPSYDPWSWLQWGREVAGGDLHTAEGPAFKPLPVAVCALLTPLGDLAPWVWVTTARMGAVLAVGLAFGLGRRLAGGSAAAGTVAAVGVALCGAFLAYSAAGVITGWVLASALAGAWAWQAGRPRLALACALVCALLQVETWPFVLLFGGLLWRRGIVDRRLLVLMAVAIPACWFMPEWLGSGDLLRSAERARIPNPGHPALADVPLLASIEQAAGLMLWPLWIGVVALLAIAWRGRGPARQALVPAAVGGAWIGLVALMSQVIGFSGEPRYALPGVALIAISGAVGLVTAGRAGTRRPGKLALAIVAGLVLLAALPRVESLRALPTAQAYQWELSNDLADAIRAAGGREAVLGCGTVYVGPLRGPLMAYRLDVPKHTVEPDLPPVAPGTVFRSRRIAGIEIEPAAPNGLAVVGHTARWQVRQAC
jgi:hypothetical protein